MGLDDVLQGQRDRAAAQRAGYGDTVREAQSRRFAFAKRVETELCDALRATGDDALANPVVQKITSASVGVTPVQVDCQGRSGTTHFQANVTCDAGAEPTCSAIKITLAGTRGRAHFRPTTHTGFSASPQVRESEFGIHAADLRGFIENVAHGARAPRRL